MPSPKKKEMAMNNNLFYVKPDIFEHEISIEKINDRSIAAVPHLFYPEGGGQPSDIGQIIANGDRYKVIRAEKYNNHIMLELDVPPNLKAGDTVKGVVDSKIRIMHSRLHTSLHILNAVIFEKFNARVTGAQISSDGLARMDFNLPDVPNSEIRDLEARINDIVEKDLTVSVYYLPYEEAMKIGGIVRTENRNVPVDKNRRVRIVEIEGLDRQACGGTHVSKTSECGRIQFQKIDNKGRGNRRIKIRL